MASLIAANNYLRQHNDFDSLSDETQRRYRHGTFFCMELVQDTHRLALMNMLLHGIKGGVEYGETLGEEGTQPATRCRMPRRFLMPRLCRHC